MDLQTSARTAPCTHVLRFRSLFDDGRGYAFPCNAEGQVDLDTLGQAALNNYLFVRGVVGRDFGLPAVEPAPH